MLVTVYSLLMRSVTIVGAGRVGGALAIALEKAGYAIDGFVVRNADAVLPFRNRINSPSGIRTWEHLAAVKSDIVIIATQDSEISGATQSLKQFVGRENAVFHTSGSLSSSVLDQLRKVGCHVGSIHPLAAISDAVGGAEKFKDSYFCLEGDAEAVAIAQDIVRDLGGKAFSIDTRFKPLYHAGAVMAAGHVVALLSMSLDMFAKCGIAQDEALEIIRPLVKSTFDNVFAVGPEQALTGPFARAETGTFERHLEILRETVNKNVLETYLSLAERSLDIAAERKRQPERFDELRKKVLIEKNTLGC